MMKGKNGSFWGWKRMMMVGWLSQCSNDLYTRAEQSMDAEERCSSLAECPLWGEDGVPIPLEHRWNSCNMDEQNKGGGVEALFNSSLKHTIDHGDIKNLPHERTWHCPSPSFEIPSTLETDTPMTTWVVKNTASHHVSLGYYNPGFGQDVSAYSPHIRGLPHLDSRAILRPGETKGVYVYFGHVFHIHQLLPDDNGVGWKQGQLLLRHVPGAIPIPSKPNEHLQYDCQDSIDRAPEEYQTLRSRSKYPLKIYDDPQSTKFMRRPYQKNKTCTPLYRTFVNNKRYNKCPLDVYFAGAVNIDDNVQTQLPKSVTQHKTDPPCGCNETFTFHLGNDETLDKKYYADEWASPLAIESTFLSHKFVARLRSNPSIIVDEIVIDRTYVQDCPLPQESKTARKRENVSLQILNPVQTSSGSFHSDPPAPQNMEQSSKSTSKSQSTKFTFSNYKVSNATKYYDGDSLIHHFEIPEQNKTTTCHSESATTRIDNANVVQK